MTEMAKLDALIDESFRLREEKGAAEEKVKDIGKKLSTLTETLRTQMKAVGTNYARGSLASATVTETTYPHIEDWGLVQQYIMENDALYLVHRRISSAAWQELRNTGDDVPGIEAFIKESISLRRLGD